MNNEELYNKVKEQSLEDFIQKIKCSPVYGFYKRFVQEKPTENSAEFLQFATIMFSMSDKEFDLLMYKLAHEVLFAMIDARLRSEIETEGGAN